MQVFYEKLASAKKKKQKSDEKRLLAGAAGVGAGYAGMRGGTALQNASMNALQGSVKDDPDGLRNILKGMGAAGSGDAFTLTGKDGRKLSVDLNDGYGNAYFDPSQRYYGTNKGKRGAISMGRGMADSDVFFHELGHATGKGAKGSLGKLRMGMATGGNIAGGMGKLTQGAGLLSAGYAGAASNKRDADRANAMANAGLLTGGIAELPTLVEEARASIRANALAKKFTGKGVNKKNLLKAYGTYAGGALSKVAPSLLAKGIAKYKQHKYRDEKTAERDAGHDHLLGALRAQGGAALGAGLGSTVAMNALGRNADVTDAAELTKYITANPGKLAAGIFGGAGLGAATGIMYHKYKEKQRRNRR